MDCNITWIRFLRASGTSIVPDELKVPESGGRTSVEVLNALGYFNDRVEEL
jgi:hypothetical protein